MAPEVPRTGSFDQLLAARLSSPDLSGPPSPWLDVKTVDHISLIALHLVRLQIAGDQAAQPEGRDRYYDEELMSLDLAQMRTSETRPLTSASRAAPAMIVC